MVGSGKLGQEAVVIGTFPFQAAVRPGRDTYKKQHDCYGEWRPGGVAGSVHKETEADKRSQDNRPQKYLAGAIF